MPSTLDIPKQKKLPEIGQPLPTSSNLRVPNLTLPKNSPPSLSSDQAVFRSVLPQTVPVGPVNQPQNTPNLETNVEVPSVQDNPQSPEVSAKAQIAEIRARLEQNQKELKSSQKALREQEMETRKQNFRQGLNQLKQFAGRHIEAGKESTRKMIGPVIAGGKKGLEWLKQNGAKIAEVGQKTTQEQVQWVKDNPDQMVVMAGLGAGAFIAAPAIIGATVGTGVMAGIGASALTFTGAGVGTLPTGLASAIVMTKAGIAAGSGVVVGDLFNRAKNTLENHQNKQAQKREQIPKLGAGSEVETTGSVNLAESQSVRSGLGQRLNDLFNRKQKNDRTTETNQFPEITLDKGLADTKQPEFQDKIDKNWQNLRLEIRSLKNFTQSSNNLLVWIQNNRGGDFGAKINSMLDQTLRTKNFNLQNILDDAKISKNPPKFEAFGQQLLALKNSIDHSKDTQWVKSKKVQLLNRLENQVSTFQNHYQELLQNQEIIKQVQSKATLELQNLVSNNLHRQSDNLLKSLKSSGFMVDGSGAQLQVEYVGTAGDYYLDDKLTKSTAIVKTSDSVKLSKIPYKDS